MSLTSRVCYRTEFQLVFLVNLVVCACGGVHTKPINVMVTHTVTECIFHLVHPDAVDKIFGEMNAITCVLDSS